MAELKVEVGVEKAIHNAVKDFAEHVLDKHGVRLDQIDIEWTGGSLDRMSTVVQQTSLKTTRSQK